MRALTVVCSCVVVSLWSTAAHAADWTVVAWNDLGMHCMDADYSVFSILPPYNTVHAQIVDIDGNLVTNPTGLQVTYEAIADASGSINRTSAGKTGFWDHVSALYGSSPPVDEGLAGFRMPGPSNTAQPMVWDPELAWFTAEGIPITPTDDAGSSIPYPMMRVTLRSSTGQVLATTDVVLPVSDEMDCRACHASGSSTAARPLAGWVVESDLEREYRLNILRLHDDHRASGSLFRSAASAVGYDPNGLESTVSAGTPILCASCHSSNALPGTGYDGVPPLTRSVHAFHAPVRDPVAGVPLDDADNRNACYRCHPGGETRCLRGAMGRAVGNDGQPAMECQSCHGSMSTVGAADRVGWLEQPACQSCHTGNATANGGQIRFESAFDTNGQWRSATDPIFATNADTPGAGFDLYRFSTGHGGLQCEACHGSTHAIFPSAQANDNVAAEGIQGHAGTLVECGACHSSAPITVSGGPHGLHSVGADWVDEHGDVVEDGSTATLAQCRGCHGADDRGTVLSRSHADRTITTELGTSAFWRGFEIGCYTCHNGPHSEDRNPNNAPSVQDATATVAAGGTVEIPLGAADPDGQSLTLRVVSPASRGTAWIVGRSAWYRAPTDFTGVDRFTFAARDGMTDSNLGRVRVTVVQTSCSIDCSSTVPTTAPVDSDIRFAGHVTTSGCGSEPAITWTFGDGGTVHGADVSHAYLATGQYDWTMTASADGVTCTQDGSILVSASGAATWDLATVVARSPGAAGTSWRSDLVVANPGVDPADVTLTFRPGGTPQIVTLSLPAMATREWPDVVLSLFGNTGTSSGSLEISSTAPLAASVRTFNSDPNGDYGQFFPAVDGSAGLTAGRSGVLPHLKRDATSRTNVGFLNLGEHDASVRVTVHGSDGQQVGDPVIRTVPARQWVQINDVISATGFTGGALAWANVEVTSGDGSVWAYASVISNDSGDPITVPVHIGP